MLQAYFTRLRTATRSEGRKALLIIGLLLSAWSIWAWTGSAAGSAAGVLAQESPLSPLITPSLLAVAENRTAAAPTPPVGLVLVAVVLVGLLLVVGMVVWRRP